MAYAWKIISTSVGSIFRNLETLDQICQDTNEAEVRGIRSMLLNHKLIFCICLMTDILSIFNLLSLTLQKQGVLLVDIKNCVGLTVDKLRLLSNATHPDEFEAILSPKHSYYASFNDYLTTLNDFKITRKNLRYHGHNITIDSFHQNIAVPLIEELINEINTAFETTDFPVLDAFHSYNPQSIRMFYHWNTVN